MSPPPNDVSPSALFEQLLVMPRPFQIVDFPRKDPITGEDVGQVHMQVLTQHERMGAMAEAEKHVRRLLKEDVPTTGQSAQGYDDMYSNECAVQILLRACRRAEDPTRTLFPNAERMRHTLTGDEVGVLYSMYLITQAQRGPIIAQMVDGEVEAWTRRLVEGASRDPLGLLSLDALMDLTMHLASRLYPSLTGTGSSSEPASDSSTSEPEDEFSSDVAPIDTET